MSQTSAMASEPDLDKPGCLTTDRSRFCQCVKHSVRDTAQRQRTQHSFRNTTRCQRHRGSSTSLPQVCARQVARFSFPREWSARLFWFSPQSSVVSLVSEFSLLVASCGCPLGGGLSVGFRAFFLFWRRSGGLNSFRPQWTKLVQSRNFGARQFDGQNIFSPRQRNVQFSFPELCGVAVRVLPYQAGESQKVQTHSQTPRWVAASQVLLHQADETWKVPAHVPSVQMDESKAHWAQECSIQSGVRAPNLLMHSLLMDGSEGAGVLTHPCIQRFGWIANQSLEPAGDKPN